MKYCNSCRKEVTDDTKYCPLCGNTSFRSVNDFDKCTFDPSGSNAVYEPAKLGPKTSTALTFSIVALLLSFIPIPLIFTAFAIVALVIAVISKKHLYGKSFKLTLSIIMCIVAFFISLIINFSDTDSSQDSAVSKNAHVATNAPTAVPIKSPQEIKQEVVDKCKTPDYKGIERDPDAHDGDYIAFSGTVIQVSESSFLGTEYVVFRIIEDNDYDKTWYATYTRAKGEKRILEDDIVTVYGKCTGVTTYEAIFGSSITIPSIDILYIELSE